MKKEEIRRKIVTLARFPGRKPKDIQKIIKRKYNKSFSVKTIRRWLKKAKSGWNLKDKTRCPHTIYYTITNATKQRVVHLRNLFPYESWKLKILLEKEGIFIFKSSIERIIKNHNLSRGSKMKGKKLKWVRWQREHPNSLWQLDSTMLDDKSGRLPIIDDCSRLCFGDFFIQVHDNKECFVGIGGLY